MKGRRNLLRAYTHGSNLHVICRTTAIALNHRAVESKICAAHRNLMNSSHRQQQLRDDRITSAWIAHRLGSQRDWSVCLPTKDSGESALVLKHTTTILARRWARTCYYSVTSYRRARRERGSRAASWPARSSVMLMKLHSWLAALHSSCGTCSGHRPHAMASTCSQSPMVCRTSPKST